MEFAVQTRKDRELGALLGVLDMDGDVERLITPMELASFTFGIH